MIKKFQYFILFLIIVAGFVVRLYKIDNPVADWHSWRQADTSAVTRNFFKYGVTVFAPRYDDFSDVSGNGLFNPKGYRFVEFPFFNLAHYLLARSFPQRPLEYWGRMTSVLTTLVSAVFIFAIVKRHRDVPTALLSSGLYLLLPYNIFFTRLILPDPMMVTLFLGCLNFFDVWFAKGKLTYLVLGLVFGASSFLIKPMAGFFLVPILFQAFEKYRFSLLKNYKFYLGLIVIGLPFLLWRTWSHRHPEGIPSSFWLLNGNGIRFRPAFFRWIFGERLGKMIMGSWGLYPFLTGLTHSLKESTYFSFWFLGSLLYLSVFATGNIQHDYYQIPIIPSIVILISIGVSWLWRKESGFVFTWTKRAIVMLCLVFMIGFTWYDIKGDYQVNNWSIVHAGQAVDKLVPKDAVVVAPYMGDTAFLYQTNRPGFPMMVLPVKDLKDRFGVMYYVSVNYDDETNAIMSKYIVLEKTSEYVIVKLEEPIRP